MKEKKKKTDETLIPMQVDVEYKLLIGSTHCGPLDPKSWT